MHINPAMRYCHSSIRMTNIKKVLTPPSFGEDMEQQELSYTTTKDVE